MDGDYVANVEVPSVEEYCHLRIAAGLTPRSRSAALAGLPNTIVGVVIRRNGRAVAMGRVIGDGLFYQLVDIAVAPGHRGRGLGKAVVGGLMERLTCVAPAEAHVSLIADGQADRLYARYGFAPTAPVSAAMAQWIGR